MLCSGRGVYGGGRCHCEAGWSGPECDQPFSELDAGLIAATSSGFVITCSIPCVHGSCANGRCQCDAEHTGAACETRKSPFALCALTVPLCACRRENTRRHSSLIR